MTDLDTFFRPRSVAIIGASPSRLNLGASICLVLSHLNFSGAVYAVNKDALDVHGAKGYKRVQDIPGPVDLAVIITRADTVPDLAEECGIKGIRHLIIESSGFSEGGLPGAALQQQLQQVTARHGIRYMGPNCLGVLDTSSRFCCFFGIIPGKYDEAFTTRKQGVASYILQSGGMGALIMDSLQTDVTGIHRVVSIGNKEDVDEADLIDYFSQDEAPVIVLYLESVKDGRKLMDAARRTTIPILAFKVGRSSRGAEAACSHTGGLANNDRIFDAACRQAGIIRLESVTELHALPKMFTSMPLLKGKRIAVFTNSGAFGGVAADLLSQEGLAVPQFSETLVTQLRSTGLLYNASNPIDVGPGLSMEAFLAIFRILLASDEIDGLLPVANVWQDVFIDALKELMSLCREYGKPAGIYIPNATERILEIRKKHQLPIFESPEQAVRGLAVSLLHHGYLAKKETTR